ncbi:response regulator transcription factor [Streptomyces olivoverticillatus]
MTIKVIIVDDQAMVRAGFAALLAAQPDIDVVGDAPDGRQGVELSRTVHPDVVLMDVRMPEMDGLEAARRLLEPPPGVVHRPKVLMLTTFDVDDYVYEALRAGASGFLLKDAPPADLISAVRVVAAGEALLAPSVTRRLIADFAGRPAPRRQRSVRLNGLTPRETEVLELIARGLSNQEIAAKLVLAEQTVKTHVGRVLAKLSLRDRAQAVVFAYESGLVTPRGGLGRVRWVSTGPATPGTAPRCVVARPEYAQYAGHAPPCDAPPATAGRCPPSARRRGTRTDPPDTP